MLIVWRGFGWLVSIIALLSFMLMQILSNQAFGEGYYKDNEWTKMAAVVMGAIVIAALGLLVNYKKRTVITDEETGNKQKSSSHTLFLVPIEFWAILLPVLFLWLQNVTLE